MFSDSKRYRTTVVLSLIFSFLIAAPAAILFFLLSGISPGSVLLLSSIMIFVLCSYSLFLIFTWKYRRRKKILKESFPSEWQKILNDEVVYYQALSETEKSIFRDQLRIFISEKHITGIGTEVDDRCRVLVAVSAIIPVFSFSEWEYDRLDEVLIYPSNFDDNYSCKKGSDNILGMVISNTSTMIISKPALLEGFRTSSDGMNVGIHEFIHKVDGEDGSIDGIPALMLDSKDVFTWKDIIENESTAIGEGKSDINPYALTNSAEFFAVVSEYFFEDPDSMSKKHPELYTILKKIFRQDTLSLFNTVIRSMFPRKRGIGRNDPCPCGSGLKYKKCCLKKVN